MGITLLVFFLQKRKLNTEVKPIAPGSGRRGKDRQRERSGIPSFVIAEPAHERIPHVWESQDTCLTQESPAARVTASSEVRSVL